MNPLEKLWTKVRVAFEEALGVTEEDPLRALSGWDMMDQVYAQLNQLDGDLAYAWPVDFFLDEKQVYMVVTAEGKLYRAAINVDADDNVILGEWEHIKTEHVPVESRIAVHRQKDGTYRFVAIANTAILNRVGEIDSMAMFDDFIRRAEDTGVYPYVTFYHITAEELLPTFRLGQCDFLARDGAVYINSGVLDPDTPLGPDVIRALETNPELWGTSIGFLPLSPPELAEIGGVKIPVYQEGEHKELSFILEEDAAAWYTVLREEVCRMDGKIVNAMQALGLSDERIEEFSELVDGVNRTVSTEDLIVREGGDPPEEPEAAADAPEEPGEAPEAEPAGDEPEGPGVTQIVLDEETVPALAEELLKSAPFQEALAPLATGLQEIGGKLEDLVSQLTGAQEEALEPIRARLEVLEKTDEKKRKDWEADLPAKRKVEVTYRPPGRGADSDPAPQSYEDRANATLEKLDKKK